MKKVISEADIIALIKKGEKTILLGNDDIITPLAADKIKFSGIEIVINSDSENNKNFDSVRNTINTKLAIGSDHTGFELKRIIKNYLHEKKYSIIDVGTDSIDPCDYPDFALAVTKNIITGDADFGIIIDATGIPSAITANKIPGIRAATCYNEFSAKSARSHNNANVLVVGAKTLGEETIKSIVDIWLTTVFEGGRHQRRLDKISAVEERLLKKE
jgi:ribose 5-phosphate isomerase B